jgi:hypothetical protein
MKSDILCRLKGGSLRHTSHRTADDADLPIANGALRCTEQHRDTMFPVISLTPWASCSGERHSSAA